MKVVKKEARPVTINKALKDRLSDNFKLEILEAEAFKVGHGHQYVCAHLRLRGKRGDEYFAELSRRRLRGVRFRQGSTIEGALRIIEEKGGLKLFVSHEEAQIALC